MNVILLSTLLILAPLLLALLVGESRRTRTQLRNLERLTS